MKMLWHRLPTVQQCPHRFMCDCPDCYTYHCDHSGNWDGEGECRERQCPRLNKGKGKKWLPPEE